MFRPRRRAGWLAAALLCACAGQQTIVVSAMVDNEPLAGLEVLAFPIDPDQVLDSLAAAADTPRPAFVELEQAMRAFVPPDERDVAQAGAPWRALRDTVAGLSDSLRHLDRQSQAYARLYERFRTTYARLAERTADRERALRAVQGSDRALAEHARQAAESLRTWETQAYAEFPDIIERLTRAAGRAVIRATVDSSGEAHLALPTGPWWIIAREPQVENPFLEYYWHRPVVVSGVGTFRVALRSRSATVRWRH